MFGGFGVNDLHHLSSFSRVGGTEILDISEERCEAFFIKHVNGLLTGKIILYQVVEDILVLFVQDFRSHRMQDAWIVVEGN